MYYGVCFGQNQTEFEQIRNHLQETIPTGSTTRQLRATDGEQRNRYGKDNAWQRSRSICNNKLKGGSTSAAQFTQNASQQCSNCGQINRHVILIIRKVMDEKVTLSYGK